MAQIKKDTSLRKAILQAAITGQLISDVEGTAETGKELLDRIIEERNKKLLAEWEDAVKKNPKTKKPAPIVASEIDEEEIPFEIPENWCWCRWGELSDSIQYGYNAPAKETGRIKMVRITDIQNGKVQWDTVPYCDISDDEITSYQLKRNDILFARTGGTVGKSFLVAEEPEDAVYAGYLIRTQYDSEKLNPKYMKMFMESQLYWDQLKNGTIATAQPNCNGQTLSKMILPLPPLSVQNAIVAKLEQVLPLVDAYENAVLQKKELKSTLSDKVKKAILQEAITGKLTEQWRKSAAITESGEQLLDRIIKERNEKALAEWEEKVKTNPKAKKPVPVVASEIEEEEIPFEVPESWCWVKGGDIFAPMESTKPQGETFVYIDTDAVNNKLNIIDNPKDLLVKEAPSRASRKLHEGDVLFSMVRPYLKNIAFVEKEFENAIASTGFYVMTQIGMYNPKYLYYMVLSPYVIDGLHYFMKGDNSPSINTTDIDSFLYPLPPLEEQEEIVKKVEELMEVWR